MAVVPAHRSLMMSRSSAKLVVEGFCRRRQSGGFMYRNDILIV
ncbi:MAG: hypothetical protein ACRDSR_09390 [Pseudonocardiaceae bacterium]